MKKLLTCTVFAAAIAIAPFLSAFAEPFIITATVNQETTIRIILNIDGEEGVQVMDFKEFVDLNKMSDDVTPDTVIPAGQEVKLRP